MVYVSSFTSSDKDLRANKLLVRLTDTQNCEGEKAEEEAKMETKRNIFIRVPFSHQIFGFVTKQPSNHSRTSAFPAKSKCPTVKNDYTTENNSNLDRALLKEAL